MGISFKKKNLWGGFFLRRISLGTQKYVKTFPGPWRNYIFVQWFDTQLDKDSITFVRIDYDININTYFRIVGGVSGFLPLTILGVCLAGTSAILDQDTAKDRRKKELQSVNTKLVSLKDTVDSQSKDQQKVNKKLKSMKDTVEAVRAGITKLDVCMFTIHIDFKN